MKPTLADFITPYKPGPKYEDRPGGQHHLKNGVVYFGAHALKADAETFRCYLGGYGVDDKSCYYDKKRLQVADPKTFQVLNYTYAKDALNVWAMGIRIPDADPQTFEACDDGALQFDEASKSLFWYGYGKDKNGVWYYDSDGKPTRLKKATAASFVSLGDKCFGKDENYVFLGPAVIPKADVATWQLLVGHYSRDVKRVFCGKDVVPDADPQTFTVLAEGAAKLRAGRDAKNYYYSEMPITAERYDKLASGELDWTELAAELNQKRVNG